MASLPPLPLSPSLDYTLLRQFVETDPTRFVLGPSFINDPIPEDFPFSIEGLPLLADAIHLSSWYVSTTSKSSGKSLRTWLSVSEVYLAWLDRVEAVYADLWREVGIYEAIQLSITPSIADNLLLAATLYFWSPISNVFLFRAGPFTPTLLDVAAIVGLYPHDITLSIAYNPDGVTDFEAHLDLADLVYTKFIHRFAGQFPASVTKKEHTAFIFYWLCYNLLCTHSQKINRDSFRLPLL
uniref:Aminotransferase-like plant mobile domain-containing protein n=1 Tax=Ananas comosus var. bracteatus TaxID=296719 RepID=A0A6V7P4N1_ANACO|nr:unnamed protein product [Ananas comosus var. bracteatus]